MAIRVRELTRDTYAPCCILNMRSAKTRHCRTRSEGSQQRRFTPRQSCQHLKTSHRGIGHRAGVLLSNPAEYFANHANEQRQNPFTRFCRLSLRISGLCYSIASQYPHLNPEQAALAGLLHDIGKLPLRDFLLAQEDLTKRQRIEV